MMTYLLEVQLCFALLWAVYRLFVQRSGALAHRRAYLLGMLAAAWIVPALSIPLWPAPVGMAVGVGGPMIAAPTPEAVPAGPDWGAIAVWGYALGVAVVLALALRQAAALVAMARRGQATRVEGARVVYGERVGAPCSFFGTVFLNPREAPERLPQILTHELAHVRLGHSVDSVLAQAAAIALWWNPAVWLWCRSLKEVHEFQADRAVLRRGFEAEPYIHLLLRTAAGIHPEFVSGFSYSLIKKRLIMMTRIPSRAGLWRFAAAAPALAATMLLFSFVPKAPTVAPAEASALLAPPAGDEPMEVVDEMPRFESGDLNAFRNWVMTRLVYPVEAQRDGIQGEVLVRFVIEKDGTLDQITVLESPADILSREAERVIALSPQWTPGRGEGKPVSVYFTIPLDFRLDRGETPPQAQSSDHRLDEVNVIGYGARRRDSAAEMDNEVRMVVDGEEVWLLRAESLRFRQGDTADNEPLVIVDGKTVNPDEFQSLDTGTIASIDVFKDESAVAHYGEAGRNGVIVITLKEQR